jgi:hypothetical protein
MQYAHGVPSGPVISALMTSTLDSSTRKNTDEPHATGKLVVNTASYPTKNNQHLKLSIK